jgi:hypothetical protein
MPDLHHGGHAARRDRQPRRDGAEHGALPLGLTRHRTPAQSLTSGDLLARTGPVGHDIAVGLLLAAGLAVAVSLVVRPPRDLRSATWRLAVGLTLMFALGPAERFGYFIYPLALAGWLALTRTRGRQTPTVESGG